MFCCDSVAQSNNQRDYFLGISRLHLVCRRAYPPFIPFWFFGRELRLDVFELLPQFVVGKVNSSNLRQRLVGKEKALR